MSTATEGEAGAKRIRLWAWALIGVAYAAPFIAAAFNYISPGQAGSIFGESAFYGLIVAIALASLSGRPARERAYGKVFGGLVLAGWIGYSIFGLVSQELSSRIYLRDVLAKVGEQQASAVDLYTRFSAVDLKSVLTPANLTTNDGRARARATLAQDASLVAERKAFMTGSYANFEHFVENRAPAHMKNVALANARKRADESLKMYVRVDAVQLAVLRDMEDILTWSEGQHLEVANSQLVFSTAAQRTELQALLARLQTDAVHQDEVVKEAHALEAAGQAQMQDVRAQAATLQQ